MPTGTAFGQAKVTLVSIRSMSVSEVSDKGSRLAKVPGDAKVADVRRLMREKGYRTVAVVDSEGGERFIGVVTRGDVLMVSSSKSEATASSLASVPPVILGPGTRLSEALNLMLKEDVWEAPIVSSGAFSGFLGVGDVIRVLLERAQEVLEGGLVRDYMTPNPVAVLADDFVARIWRRMVELRYAGLPVVEEGGRLVGMITQYDLLVKGFTRIHLESESGASRGPRVREAMTRAVRFVTPWSTLADAARLMVGNGFGRIPVVDDPRGMKLVGVIDREDVIKVLGELP